MIKLERSIITVFGDDSKTFLQGLITQNIEEVVKKTCYSLMLNNKGFIAFDFFIFFKDNAFYIDIENTFTKSFIQKLTIYKLRSNITIKHLDDIKVYSTNEEINTNDNLAFFKDPRHNNLGFRLISSKELQTTSSIKNYKQQRYNLAIAEGSEIEPNKAVALEWGFEELNAISFNKGCYLGQELITASKRKLTIRKRLLAFKFSGNCEIGDKILTNNLEKAGTVKYNSNGYCLALIKMRYKDETLTLNEEQISLITPKHVTNYSLH